MSETESTVEVRKHHPARRGQIPLGPWRRLLRKIRNEGLAYTAQALFNRLPPDLLYANLFYIFALDLRRFDATARIDPEVREARPEDLPLLIQSDRPAWDIEHRFKRGARAWYLRRGDHLIGHAWLDPGYLEADYCLRIKGSDNDPWSMDGWVDPACRGEGYYTVIKGAAAAHYARAGQNRVLSHVDMLNRKSVRANLAIGSKCVRRGFVLHVPGLTVVINGPTLRIGRWNPENRFEMTV